MPPRPRAPLLRSQNCIPRPLAAGSLSEGRLRRLFAPSNRARTARFARAPDYKEKKEAEAQEEEEEEDEEEEVEEGKEEEKEE